MRSLLLCAFATLILPAQTPKYLNPTDPKDPACWLADNRDDRAHGVVQERLGVQIPPEQIFPPESRRSVAAFGVYDADGKLRTVADAKGKLLVIGFWDPTCNPSRNELMEMRYFQGFEESRGLEIWAVHRRPWPEILSFLRTEKSWIDGVKVCRSGLSEHGHSILVDEMRSLPAVFIVDKEGRLARAWFGYYPNRLSRALNQLMNEPAPPKVKPSPAAPPPSAPGG